MAVPNCLSQSKHELHNETLFIKIPASIWNEQTNERYFRNFIKIPTSLWNEQSAFPSPFRHPNTKTANTFPRAIEPEHARPLKLDPTQLAPTFALMPTSSTTSGPSRCKTPLYRYVSGLHDIRLEAPCLQSSCKICVEWHPNLVSDPVWPVPRPVVESLSPIPDPRLLKGWNPKTEYMDVRRVSDLSVLELPEPVLQPVASYLDEHRMELPLTQKYDSFLPTPLLDRTISRPNSAHSLWRTSPRRRYTAVLKFQSQDGKQQFAERVARNRIGGINKIEGTNKINGGRKMVRGILKVRDRESVGGLGNRDNARERRSKKVRFRHRVRLVFESEEGKLKFGEVVRGWR